MLRHVGYEDLAEPKTIVETKGQEEPTKIIDNNAIQLSGSALRSWPFITCCEYYCRQPIKKSLVTVFKLHATMLSDTRVPAIVGR